MRTLLILLRKEFLLFSRDKFLPKIAFIFPCMVILIVPFATTMDVRHVAVAVVNHDPGTLSRKIMASMDASPYFTLTPVHSQPEALEMVKDGKADVILEIPSQFEKSLATGHPEAPHISANGVNGIKGMLGAQYVSTAAMQAIGSYMGMSGEGKVTVNYLYNPTLNYRDFMIPALMIMLLIMLCGFLPALNLVSEKETGTIEQINVTPVRTSVFVLSKVIPYWIIGLVVIGIAMVLAKIVYGLWPAGSLWAIFLATAIFILVMSGIGILIANMSATMSQSMFLTFFVVLVFVLMSGLITPVSSMPHWAQTITCAIPPRSYIDIIRALYLKGTSVAGLAPQYLALTAFAIVLNVLATLTYAKKK